MDDPEPGERSFLTACFYNFSLKKILHGFLTDWGVEDD